LSRKELEMRRIVNAVVVLAAAVLVGNLGVPAARAEEPAGGPQKRPFAFKQVIAIYGAPKDIASVNFVLSGDWKYWRDRGGVAALGQTWFDILKNPVDKGANVLVNMPYGDNPEPTVAIDEFGFDFDGQVDQ